MEVILLQDVEKLGSIGEIVAVKNGFGRNYLIPQKLAIIANNSNRKVVEDKLRQKTAELARHLGEFQAIAEKLAGVTIKVGAKTGTSGKIFGSVTNLQLSNAIKEQTNIDIDRKQLSLPDEVKTIGTYEATANIHPKVDCKINFEVISE